MSLHLHTSFYNSMHLCSCLLPYLALPLLISRDYPYFVKSCVLYVISISIDLLSLSVMHSYTCISFRRHLISASLIEFQKKPFRDNLWLNMLNTFICLYSFYPKEVLAVETRPFPLFPEAHLKALNF